MKDMDVKRTVSLSEEEMKEVLGGDASFGNSYCQQMDGGIGCTGYCEPIFDLQHNKTIPQYCVEVGRLPSFIPGEPGHSICECRKR